MYKLTEIFNRSRGTEGKILNRIFQSLGLQGRIKIVGSKNIKIRDGILEHQDQ
jgi:hypothetical protein